MKRAFVVGGLVFGDEGKGTTVDYLVRQYDASVVIRYNGGSQAGHNVVTPDGIHHCFAQFGSGTLVPGVWTYLSRFMFIDPMRLMSEYDVLAGKGFGDALDRLIISGSCPIITPYHKLAGQIQELINGDGRLGSCGMGVGDAMKAFANDPVDCLTMSDLSDPWVLERKLRILQAKKKSFVEMVAKFSTDKAVTDRIAEINSDKLFERCLKSYSAFSVIIPNIDDGRYLSELLSRSGNIVFEGAQGALLDRELGFQPYITRSNCSFANADELLTGYDGRIVKLGITRAFATRHGNGPFVSEAALPSSVLVGEHNVQNEWQGHFRVGWLDLVALRRGFDILGKLDGVVVTNLDRVSELDELRVSFVRPSAEGLTKDRIIGSGRLMTDGLFTSTPVYRLFRREGVFEEYMKYLEKYIPVPIVVTSRGPTARDKESILNI